MKILIEFILAAGTLAGYFMVTHGYVSEGASISAIVNLAWVFYATEKQSISIGIVNVAFLIINLGLLV